MFPLLLAAGAVALYYALSGSSGDCVDANMNPAAAEQLLLLLEEPHTRAELDAAVLVLTGYPRAQECVRNKRGSDE